MAGGAREGWRADPYRRHDLRYWDGLAWTAHVSDMGVVGDDPVFPVLDSDAHSYLAPTRSRRRRRLPGLDRAAAWAVSGFLGVIALATFAAVDGGVAPAPLAPQVAEVEAAAAQVPSADGQSRNTAPTASTSATTAPSTAGKASARARRTTALALLATLPTRPAIASPTAADDERLRTAQPDPDGTACDVRQEVLRRDLARVVLAADRCTVRSGVLRDPYSGATVRYRPGAAVPAVQIDQAVPMSAAWRTGAALLGDEQLRALANDPLNLLALSTGGRRARGSSDAAGWLPRDRSARCAYAARQIAVKVAYGLWVTRDERTALHEVLTTCPQEPLPAR